MPLGMGDFVMRVVAHRNNLENLIYKIRGVYEINAGWGYRSEGGKHSGREARRRMRTD